LRVTRLFALWGCFLLSGVIGFSHKPADEASLFIQQIVELTNAERANHGVPPLKLEPNLCRAAQWMTQDMAAYHYFGHEDSQGRRAGARVPTFDYPNYSALGENLAVGYRTAAEVVAAWMKSPGHRANILNPDFREIGVAYWKAANDIPNDTYWVQEFGSRYTSYPVLIDQEMAQTDNTIVNLYVHGNGWAEEMRFSSDGVHWTEWEPHTAVKPWELSPGSGTRQVYVQLRNGSTVFTASDRIELRSEIVPTIN
jgi:hypothetical protein